MAQHQNQQPQLSSTSHQPLLNIPGVWRESGGSHFRGIPHPLPKSTQSALERPLFSYSTPQRNPQGQHSPLRVSPWKQLSPVGLSFPPKSYSVPASFVNLAIVFCIEDFLDCSECLMELLVCNGVWNSLDYNWWDSFIHGRFNLLK